jgi:hypothetical protein
MVALRRRPQVPAPARGGQRVQHRLHHRRALRGQVTAEHPGAVEGGVHEQRPVQVPVIVILRVRRGCAVPDLGADRGQLAQPGPGPRRRDEDLLGLAPVFIGDRGGPPGQLQRDGLGDGLAAQPGEQRAVALGSAACPRVTRVLCTSQVRVLRCPSPRCPPRVSNAASIRPRPAASTASARSRPRRHSATAAAGRPAASRSARNPAAHSSISSASPALAGSTAVHTSCLTSPELGSDSARV